MLPKNSPGRAEPDCSRDRLPCGAVTLLQPRTGQRATTDSLLLAAVLPDDFAGLAVDLGCGTGAIAFRIAARCPAARVTGIERNAVARAAAQAALQLPENAAFAPRVTIAAGDITQRETLPLADAGAAAVLFNPPYFEEGRGRPSPDPVREAARRLPPGGLPPWLNLASTLLAPGGLMAAIVPPARLPAFFAHALGATRLTAIHTRAGAPAHRVIVTQEKGRRSDTVIAPPLILHDDAGAPTEVATALAHARISLSAHR